MARNSKRSQTVDLHGFTVDELRAIVLASSQADRFGKLPDDALSALSRLHRACGGGDPYVEPRTDVWKVDRPSLEALADAARPFVSGLAKAMPAARSAFAKLDARLKSTRGRPVPPGIWEKRAADVKRVRQEWRDEHGYPPTDEEVARALGELPDAVRKWRFRHPEMFAPPMA